MKAMGANDAKCGFGRLTGPRRTGGGRETWAAAVAVEEYERG